MNNEETMDSLVHDGIAFLESLTRHYGTDRGMELWEQFGEILGREIKGKIFFAMISGDSSGNIRFKAGDAVINNAVATIKTIRNYTGMGLKEAKDIWEFSKTHVATFKVDVNSARAVTRELRDLGCNIF